MFFSKKISADEYKNPRGPMNSDEYDKLSKRLTDVESDIDKFSSKFMSLRGLVHRKFVGVEDPESETNKSIDGLDSLRKNGT